MLGYYQPEHELIHFSMTCPVCQADVHAVAALEKGRARWSCTSCLVSGFTSLQSADVAIDPSAAADPALSVRHVAAA